MRYFQGFKEVVAHMERSSGLRLRYLQNRRLLVLILLLRLLFFFKVPIFSFWYVSIPEITPHSSWSAEVPIHLANLQH